MLPVNFRSFRRKLTLHKKAFRSFLRKVQKNPPKGLDKLTAQTEPLVWKEIDCLSCANCCKSMTPTFTRQDIKRISSHFNQTQEEFIKQWLRKQDGDYINKVMPCQFLDLKTNKCTIYEIRPADCAGFPHLSKKKWIDYTHVHIQNIDYCPATYKMVEKLNSLIIPEKVK